MAITYDRIATTTVSGTAASLDFTSIPATYTDLRWVLSGTASDITDIQLTFNGATSNYSYNRMWVTNATATSSRQVNAANLRLSFSNPSTTYPWLITGDIFSYANSTYKSMLSEYYGSQFDAGSSAVGRYAHTFRSTSAINQITFSAPGSTFANGTVATIYGILKA